MSNNIEIDWQTRQQIAIWAGVFGAIAALIATSGGGDQTRNPLVVGCVAFVVSWAMSLLNRAVGVGIIVLSGTVMLKSCS
jgi:protein-S-isoprenylcysteine O-methyltransferase Ste14